ncbi:MAG: undecaprenyl-diphosphate phosphatase [Clostridia bacterium]|nr:undecaprenyl-diphosphate phosphatase [Clostridia bacterium]
MLYSLLLALLFGLIEGITEWLPISSTGHLILLRALLPVTFDDAFFSLFEVVIQLGAIAAVMLLFWERLFPFSRRKSAAEKRHTWQLWGKILIATLPAALLGALLGNFLDTYLFNPLTVGITLIFYGILFLIPPRVWQKKSPSDTVSAKKALGIGLFQSLALIPGTSRSGATLLGGSLLGVQRPAAAEFSFFLAIPTMAGAGLFKCLQFFLAGHTLSTAEWLLLTLGTLTAFLVSRIVIRFLLDFVRRHGLAPFGIWRISLGTLVLLWYFL